MVIGDSHLRSVIDGFLEMPDGRMIFGFMSTAGGDADDLRREICHADSTDWPTPDLVCLLAPSNNLTSSLTVELAASAFQRLLRTAVSKWPKVYIQPTIEIMSLNTCPLNMWSGLLVRLVILHCYHSLYFCLIDLVLRRLANRVEF